MSDVVLSRGGRFGGLAFVASLTLLVAACDGREHAETPDGAGRAGVGGANDGAAGAAGGAGGLSGGTGVAGASGTAGADAAADVDAAGAGGGDPAAGDIDAGTDDGTPNQDATVGTSSTDAAAGHSSDAAAGMSGMDAAAAHTGADAAAGTSDGGAVGTGGAGGMANCGLPATFGTLTFDSNTEASAEFQEELLVNDVPSGTIDEVAWLGQFNVTSSTEADLLSVSLSSMLDPFGDKLTTVSNLDLATEGDLSTCGACVFVVINGNPQDQAVPTDQLGPVYAPTSGTLTVTQLPSFPAVAGSRLTGSISEVVFRHVTVDPTTAATTPVGDGCGFTITFASFDSSVVNGAM